MSREPRYRCNLCWATFESPVALLEHEIAEEGQDYPMPYAPSMKADTK